MGITPAYAGKSHSPRTPGARAPGSPPRMRGKVRSVACSMTSPVDHPRVCGEKHGVHVSLMWSAGSPPRMRGKGAGEPLRLLVRGITPAYAGKRTWYIANGQGEQDHPRVCGEKKAYKDGKEEGEGSPPRMRGKEKTQHVVVKRPGITPAYAGKSKEALSEEQMREDHPRVCGEKFAICTGSKPSLGSPPRMRGKALQAQAGFRWSGITPAYAGKSAPGKVPQDQWRDHPRVCGEKS